MPYNFEDINFEQTEDFLNEFNLLIEDLYRTNTPSSNTDEVVRLAKEYKTLMQDNYIYRCKRPERELLEKLFAALEKL